MQATRASKEKRLAQTQARDAGRETFEFPCSLHGDHAQSDTAYGWCIQCRQQVIANRSTSDERSVAYRAENLGASRANAAATRWMKVTGGRLPAWYETEREAIERFYAECPEGFHVDHCVPIKGKDVIGLHRLCNLQYLPDVTNGWKSNRVGPNVRCQRPANAFPGGAMDPEQTTHDQWVTEMLSAIIDAMRQEERASKRRRGGGITPMADDLAEALA